MNENKNSKFEKIDELVYGTTDKVKLILKYIFTTFLYIIIGIILFVVMCLVYYDALTEVPFTNDILYKFIALFETMTLTTFNIIETICAFNSILILFLIYRFPKILDKYVRRYKGWNNVPSSGFTIPWLCLIPETLVFFVGYYLFSGRDIHWYQVLIFLLVLALVTKPIVTKLGKKSLRATIILQIVVFVFYSVAMHFLVDQILFLVVRIIVCLLVVFVLKLIMDFLSENGFIIWF